MFAFIPTDFLQPDRDQWKSWMTLAALGLALTNVGLMRIIWTKAFGWQEVTYKRLSRVHRTIGYTAIAIMLFIAIVTCIGIVGYGGYGARPSWHSWLGITTLSLIGIKVFAVRKGLPQSPAFRRWAMLLAAGGTVVLAILAATVLEGSTAFIMPLFPLVALVGFFLWKRFGYLPVVGSGLALAIALLFVSSGGWWFVHNASAGDKPDVSSVMALQGDVQKGLTLFHTKGCSACHGDKGFGGVGPSLRSSDFAYRFSNEQIAQQVRTGKGIMPAFTKDQISDVELADIIAGIRNWY